MSEPLWQIDARLQELLDRAWAEAEENEGLIPDELSSEIDALEMAFMEKAEGTALVVKNYMSEAKAVREEAQNLLRRARSAENRGEWLKGYLGTLLRGRPLKTPRAVVSWRKSVAVEIDDGAPLGVEYQRVKVEPDKTKIKDALKKGVVVVGAKLVEHNNIQVR